MNLPCDLPLLTSDAGLEQAKPTEFRRVCLVVLGGESFAIDLRQVREVFELESMTPVPGMPASLVGVANLRGTIIPLADLRQSLGVSPSTTTRYVIVVRHDAHQIGLLIDGVPEIREIVTEDMLSDSEASIKGGHRFLSGLVRVENRVSGMLAIPSLLASVEDAVMEPSLSGSR